MRGSSRSCRRSRLGMAERLEVVLAEGLVVGPDEVLVLRVPWQ